MTNKNSIWETETFYRNREVIIVGAGFTGLWTAICIREKYPEKSVLVVERSSIPMGASTRNAGFACFGSLTEIIADADKMGWHKTLDLVKMRFEGLQKIQRSFKPTETDFELCGGYELLDDATALQRMEEVNAQLQPITGLQETYFLSQDKMEGFGLACTGFLVENPLEGRLHSGKLLQMLLKRCTSLGVEFLFGTEVLHIEESSDSVKIVGKNYEVSSQKLVIATNAFTHDLAENLDIVPSRGQILLTEPIPNLKLNGTFHYDEGFYYFRNLGSRVLLGGARNQDIDQERTLELETSGVIQDHLERFLKEVILPEAVYGTKGFRIAARWSGIMAMGSEKSPIVEKISKRQVCAVRLSGMGVALAPKIGDLVTEMLY